MKFFLINLLLLLMFSLVSCGNVNLPSGSTIEDAVLTDILVDATKGKTGGVDRNIPISFLTDEEENPIMDVFESIEFYPQKSVSEDWFGFAYFYIYCEVNCEVYIHFTIEDEVIEYEWIEEKVEDPETGEITIVRKEIEVNRYTEVIDLAEGGEYVKLYANEKCAVIYSMDYVIKSYSSSTCFNLSLRDNEGNLIPYKWGIDELQIFTSKIEENN